MDMTQSFEERFDEEFPELWGSNDGRAGYDRLETESVKSFIRQEKELSRKEESEKIPEILTEYSEWLSKHGYMDSDWYCEEPHSVEAFLKDKPRR